MYTLAIRKEVKMQDQKLLSTAKSPNDSFHTRQGSNQVVNRI